MRIWLALGLLLTPLTAAADDGDWYRASWRAYVEKFIQADGRVIDFAVASGITTSEGQTYAMLRALWADDRAVFDRLLRWTDDNLARDGSPLPAWKWGAREPGAAWGIVDANSAADADVMLALALHTAARRWDRPELGTRAREIGAAIWEEEVERIGERWYLLPGKWARAYDPVPLNPSYYVPSFLRRLAAVDPERPWADLAASTYVVIEPGLPVTGLPSDWVSIDRKTGRISPGALDGSLSGQFGHDAYRVYWNVALDHAWDRTPEALVYLRRQTWLVEYLQLNGTLPREVSPTALPRLGGPEPLALHGSLFPAFVATGRSAAAAATRAHFEAAYRDGVWGAAADYYAQNLVWFGKALGEGRLAPFPR